MFLTPREQEKLLITVAAEVARRRKAKGLKLNYVEALSIITDFVLESAREGKPMSQIIKEAQNLLTEDDVMEMVPSMLEVVQVEATFPDGTKLVTIRNPIPGRSNHIITAEGEIEIAKDEVELEVTNTGDRPIQVGSHYHFFEVNRALKFDREKAFGMRLAIPSGTSVRFEPGQARVVKLRPIGGARRVEGLNGLTEGSLHSKEQAIQRAKERGFT
ncbi:MULTISPECIES: urease subunit gamma [Metallosphaera]|uniref:urease n=3 Tax=Metallosphaera TaxID=41980 RepID=A4YF58_METS5|nr:MULTISPECIES: urease subunit gamma [Metallosphaera]ABP95060.1 urease, gamma subunit [Metallosphaera sedula DSM 5348]AIM27046.1 urease, gamma subunit [Metallosphaera sedula]AKV73962.1 Urease subunit alpha [Metallosphaera sedula]AKV76201.1 Urease subunit alpha [Metallosphaera sedula]AKV78454.1 Urease subunit alpha [Metallosphaera sedula]